ncbi:Serine/threonine-protein kinase ATG1 [Escovopsis weberi]|uniref:non-specific serine/threonine protein kinase n=1 Tax=Escovopsis weberi TaxID=150374 RepID=A0A0M8MTD1_ESCWE|nr:Serine/threonine-protein kinase ATG1 [Escovopsis weberi]
MANRHDASSFGSKRLCGRNIGQFTIDKEIGKGSFAQVYVGWHKETKARVAIKSVELDRLNKKLKENLYGEIQILKTLRHPHIVALHDCLESSTHINLVMEYCELGDLSLFIKKRDKLDTHPATVDIARKYPSPVNSGLHEVVIRHFLKQLSSALEFLRRKNYIHRDVKPQNLLLLPSREFRQTLTVPIMEASHDSLIPISGLAHFPMLKLADFGFARVLPATSLAETLCGSPLYMAPEILRYERYDAKADLWSVGTVLYEMITGRPPFRARNHVELLKKIEAAEDVIKFPKEVIVSSEMKALVRGLLKRGPLERMSFESFFNHPVIVNDIPGLAQEDIPKPKKKQQSQSQSQQQSQPQSGLETIHQKEVLSSSLRIDALRNNGGAARYRRSSAENQRLANSPRDVAADDLGIHRSSSHSHRQNNHHYQHAAGSHQSHARSSDRLAQENASPPGSLIHEGGRLTRVSTNNSNGNARNSSSSSSYYYTNNSNKPPLTDSEKAAQDVMFERDYVVVERKHVEVNALADELAANEKLASQSPSSLQPGQITRYNTQQGPPNSTSGALSAPSSRNQLVAAQGRSQNRRSSYEKVLSAGPNSASSAISKAIQDASLRLFGFKVSPIRPKGQSPPLYQPFPAYPTPTATAGLIKDSKSSQSEGEDIRAAQTIEDLATRSDCVYGFAEVKYKQLVPMAPSAERGLGGVAIEQLIMDEDGLTIEAVTALSEEALVLYVKSLSLLARAMDIASLWWSKKSAGAGGDASSPGISQSVVQRINAAVQWVRQRFNEVLEKAEVVRLKLTEAQKLLPNDHPSHPSNQGAESIIAAGSGITQVCLTPGISAEKLMYDRALEMSRAAAIDEVTNANLPGCEISYITAIRLLEAVLDGGEEASLANLAAGKEAARGIGKDSNGDLDSDEEAHIRNMIKMITGRLSTVRKKQRIIAEANSRALPVPRRRSGDSTPRSLPLGSS